MSRYLNLFKTISEIRPKVLLEIGTWNGIHSVQMIMAAQKYVNKLNEIEYYGFDLFEDFREAEKEFCPKPPAKLSDVEARLKASCCTYSLYKGKTSDTLPVFSVPTKNPVDLIFVDGGHSLETIDNDWINIQRLISNKTVVIFDDYYPDDSTKGCKKLINDLIYNSNWAVELLEPIDHFPHTNTTVQMVRVQQY